MNTSHQDSPSPLPYRDTKPVGARDFYFAINATFRFILARLGENGLRAYWNDLGHGYYAPVSAVWRRDGLPGVAAYWRAFFDAEPGAEVVVEEAADAVTLDVRVCPAIRQLRDGGREIVPCFCQHCYFVSEAMARDSGLTLRVLGGNGACRQTFYPARAEIAAQQMSDIATATSATEGGPAK